LAKLVNYNRIESITTGMSKIQQRFVKYEQKLVNYDRGWSMKTGVRQLGQVLVKYETSESITTETSQEPHWELTRHLQDREIDINATDTYKKGRYRMAKTHRILYKLQVIRHKRAVKLVALL